jgi:hypothetical protein
MPEAVNCIAPDVRQQLAQILGPLATPPLNIPREALLDRRQLAAALTVLGFTITKGTLEALASRGGGPPYRRWGNTVVRYRWSEALEWAENRLSAPHVSPAAHQIHGTWK